jgi:hypothetical protein
MITNYGSLVFIGGLIIMNIRGFTLNFLKFMRIFFRSFLSQFISSDFTILFASEVIAVRSLPKLDLFLVDIFPDAEQLAEKVQRKYEKFFA